MNPNADYVRIVDISRNQGAGNMHTLRATGVDGLIIRLTHGLVLDDHAHAYHHDALDAGFTDDDIVWYTFCNPKRGSAKDCANFLLDNLHAEVGHLRTAVMSDIESYQRESPNIGLAWPAHQYAPWLHEFVGTMAEDAPELVQFGYTNNAYWQGGVNDPTLPDDEWVLLHLDWLCARYPCYSHADYASHPLPATVAGWPAWAFARASGPVAPPGVDPVGWQFSAGFNQMGRPFGFSCDDLDLDIVYRSAWNRWTHRDTPIIITPPTTPQEDDDMPRIATNNETRHDPFTNADYTDHKFVFVVADDGKSARQVDGTSLEGALYWATDLTKVAAYSNAQLDEWSAAAPPPSGGSTPSSFRGTIEGGLQLDAGTFAGTVELAGS